MDTSRGAFSPFINYIGGLIDSSTSYVRGKVTAHQKHYPWYHQKFRRVPTIDECYTNDLVCMTEANSQFQRDKMVDEAILIILRERTEECRIYYGYEEKDRFCADIIEDYKEAAGNWFCKYGDLPPGPAAKDALMKQKHRMVWERRHGKVGSGTKFEE